LHGRVDRFFHVLGYINYHNTISMLLISVPSPAGRAKRNRHPAARAGGGRAFLRFSRAGGPPGPGESDRAAL
jgi:hypothetical protein